MPADSTQKPPLNLMHVRGVFQVKRNLSLRMQYAVCLCSITVRSEKNCYLCVSIRFLPAWLLNIKAGEQVEKGALALWFSATDCRTWHLLLIAHFSLLSHSTMWVFSWYLPWIRSLSIRKISKQTVQQLPLDVWFNMFVCCCIFVIDTFLFYLLCHLSHPVGGAVAEVWAFGAPGPRHGAEEGGDACRTTE